MRHGLTLIAALAVLIAPASAAQGRSYTERELGYQLRFCDGMALEVNDHDGGRIDCVSGTHAIEVDFDGHWKEAIGQALAYGAATGLRPGIILVCTGEARCLAASLRILQTISAYRVPLTLWECSPADRGLDGCLRRECGPEGCAP